MKQPYILIERGGWYHAYGSRWAWFRGHEPLLRARTWEAMQKSVAEMKSIGRLVLQTSR